MTISVRRPGLLTTVQDAGRFGLQHLGVPPSGPMDPLSFRLANLVAGNDEAEAALEVTVTGPELRFQSDAVIAICGADLSPMIDGREVPLNEAVSVARGATLEFGARRNGTRAYVAVRGGIDVPVVLGSRATSLQAQLPGLAGRALRAGDVLPIGGRVERDVEPDVEIEMTRDQTRPAVLRFVAGPDSDRFPADAIEGLASGAYRIAPQSNRMGYRLEGAPVLPVERGELLSEASPSGTIQVPPSGQPILLMADRQTSGGYPRIGTVITADLPVAGQLAPGDEIRFERCDRETAVAALRAQEAFLRLVGGRA
jgi:antagonist of KipI